VQQSVVVVGAGIIGCAIARELAGRGCACTLIDDRGVAGGATHASAGMLAPYIEAHERGPLLDLGVRSLALYPDWIDAIRAEVRVDVEFGAIGTLEVATTPDRAAALRQASAGQGRWLEGDEVRRSYPFIGAALGGRIVAAHGYVVPPQLADALATAALSRGARIQAARVRRITRAGDHLQVETSADIIEADRVIVAAGAWAGGIDGVRMPPVEPIRGQIVELAWPAAALPSIVWGPRCYVVPRLDHTVLVGASAERVGYDERTTAAGIRDLLDAACELLPDARHASFLGARAGLRPATPDELPALGDDPSEAGVVYALGHYRNGVLLAPITAKLIGDLVADGRRDPALDSFRVDRFRSQIV